MSSPYYSVDGSSNPSATARASTTPASAAASHHTAQSTTTDIWAPLPWTDEDGQTHLLPLRAIKQMIDETFKQLEEDPASFDPKPRTDEPWTDKQVDGVIEYVEKHGRAMPHEAELARFAGQLGRSTGEIRKWFQSLGQTKKAE